MVLAAVTENELIAHAAAILPVPGPEAQTMANDQGPMATRAGEAGVTTSDAALAARMEDRPEGILAALILGPAVPSEAREARAEVDDQGPLATNPLMAAIQGPDPVFADAFPAGLHGLAEPILPAAPNVRP